MYYKIYYNKNYPLALFHYSTWPSSALKRLASWLALIEDLCLGMQVPVLQHESLLQHLFFRSWQALIDHIFHKCLLVICWR